MTVNVTVLPTVHDIRKWTVGGTTDWQDALDEAAGGVLVIPEGTYVFSIAAGQRYTVSSNTIIRGEGGTISATGGNHSDTNGTGFVVDATSASKRNIHFENLYFVGDHASFSWVSGTTYQSMCIRINATAGTTTGDITIKGCHFEDLYGFPAQFIVGAVTEQSWRGMGFDVSGCYFEDCANGLNMSAPGGVIAHNTFINSEGIESAQHNMLIIGNYFRECFGAASLGGDATANRELYGIRFIGNVIDGNQEVSAGLIVAEGAYAPIIAYNIFRKTEGYGLYIAPAATTGVAPAYTKVHGNEFVACGGVTDPVPGVTRTAAFITRHYTEFLGNTILNDTDVSSDYSTQYGVIWQGNHGIIDHNRLTGTTYDIQFDGTSGNNACIENFFGAGNQYDPARVNFIRAPTDASYFKDGSVMRFAPSGTGARPAASVNYRGLRAIAQGGTGVADTDAICAKDGADAYGWRAIY